MLPNLAEFKASVANLYIPTRLQYYPISVVIKHVLHIIKSIAILIVILWIMFIMFRYYLFNISHRYLHSQAVIGI